MCQLFFPSLTTLTSEYNIIEVISNIVANIVDANPTNATFVRTIRDSENT